MTGRSQRLQRIRTKLLENTKLLVHAWLAEEGISEHTLYRDLQKLNLEGIPTVRKNGWVSLPEALQTIPPTDRSAIFPVFTGVRKIAHHKDKILQFIVKHGSASKSELAMFYHEHCSLKEGGSVTGHPRNMDRCLKELVSDHLLYCVREGRSVRYTTTTERLKRENQQSVKNINQILGVLETCIPKDVSNVLRQYMKESFQGYGSGNVQESSGFELIKSSVTQDEGFVQPEVLKAWATAVIHHRRLRLEMETGIYMEGFPVSMHLRGTPLSMTVLLLDASSGKLSSIRLDHAVRADCLTETCPRLEYGTAVKRAAEYGRRLKTSFSNVAEKPFEVQLRFRPVATELERARMRIPMISRMLEERVLEDGSWCIRIEAVDRKGLLAWLRTFGRNVELLMPEGMAGELLRTARKVVAMDAQGV